MSKIVDIRNTSTESSRRFWKDVNNAASKAPEEVKNKIIQEIENKAKNNSKN